MAQEIAPMGIHSGSWFYGQQNAMLSMATQLLMIHESAAVVQEQKIKEELPEIPPEIMARLKEFAVKKATYLRYREGLGERDMTVGQMIDDFCAHPFAVNQQVAKLADGGFIRVVGNEGRYVIWGWVG